MKIQLVSKGGIVHDFCLEELRAMSDYIEYMVRINRMDRVDMQSIDVEDWNSWEIDLLQSYIVGGQLNDQNIFIYVKLADYFQMSSLKEETLRYLDSNLEKNWEIWGKLVCKMYDTYHLPQLRESVIGIACANLSIFPLLPEEEKIAVIKHDMLKVNNEVEVLQLILGNFKDPEVLLNAVRFELMSESERTETKRLLEQARCRADDECLRRMDTGAEWQSSRPARREVLRIVTFGGFTPTEKSTNVMQMADPAQLSQRTFAWRRLKAHGGRMPKSSCEHASCSLNGFVYFAGGQAKLTAGADNCSAKTHCFNPRTFRWRTCADMPIARSLFYMGSVGNLIFAVGGGQRVNRLTNRVSSYEPKSDEWHDVSAMPERLQEHSGCTLDGKMYVSGGNEGETQVNVLFCYDPSADEWTRKAPMRFRRAHHVMQPLTSGQIVVAGGVIRDDEGLLQDVMCCEVFNVAINQWTVAREQLLYASSSMPSLLHDNRMYVFGGTSYEPPMEHHFIQCIRLKPAGERGDVNDVLKISFSGIIKPVRTQFHSFALHLLNVPEAKS